MTLLDRYDSFRAKYISRTKLDAEPDQTNDKPIFGSTDFDRYLKKWSRNELTPARRRELVLSAPLFKKGINKKSMDTFRAWFKLVNIKDQSAPSVLEQKIFELFERRNNFKKKLTQASKCAKIYGDGFILKKYEYDWDLDGEALLSKEVKPHAMPYRLTLLDPEKAYEFVHKSTYWKNKGIVHLHYTDDDGNERFIHPSRLIHVKEDELPFSLLGLALTDQIRNIIESEADIDIATGEILKWFSHGTTSVTKPGMERNERDEILKELMKHPNFFANDDKFKMEMHNPQAIDPKPFYEYLVMCIAAILVMPTHVLTGVQIGKTTGAQIGYSDYNRDLKDMQELVYSPLIVDLYSELLDGYWYNVERKGDSKANPREFKYEVEWNQSYIDELAEAEIDAKRTATAVQLKSVDIIDDEEARNIYNHGHYDLDPNKKIKQRHLSKAVNEQPKNADNNRMELPVKKPKEEKKEE